MTTVPHQPDKSSSRRRWLKVLYGLLLVSAVFAAWQAHELWQSGRPEEPQPKVRVSPVPPRRVQLSTRTWMGPAAGTSPTAGSQPATMFVEDPFRDGGVEVLEEDPTGIPPPAGASGRRAFSLPSSGVMAQYSWEGPLAEAALHYEDALRRQGFRLLDNAVDPAGRQSLKFESPDRRGVVVLRPDPQDAKMVDIEVSVVRR
jgi:hypothetical protein